MMIMELRITIMIMIDHKENYKYNSYDDDDNGIRNNNNDNNDDALEVK